MVGSGAMTLPESELHRVARQLALPGYGLEQQERLYNSHVLMIGAGGLGSPCLQSLASAGVGTITVIDDDTVDLSNIHRQILFGAGDVGRPKVEVARERLEALQPGITVHTLQERLTPENALELFSSVDLVIDGSDSFTTKYLVADAAEITGTPLLWATVLRYHGELALFDSGPNHRGVGLRDLYPEQPDAASVPDCATAGVFGATTAVMGALLATEAINFLTDITPAQPGRLISYDALPATMRSFTIAADPSRELVTTLQTTYAQTACAVSPSLLNGSLVGLDIREPHEVFLADLPIKSIKLPLSTINSEKDILKAVGEHKKLLVYCASGRRSSDFVERYRDLGVDFISLPGGVNGQN